MVQGSDAAVTTITATTRHPLDRFHSFDFGGVHFVAYSTEHDLAPQLALMDADLRAVDRATTPWVVAFGHRPLYCSTNDYYDCKVAGPTILGPKVEPLLQRYKVDLALFGHLHNYERRHRGVRTVESVSCVTRVTRVICVTYFAYEFRRGAIADSAEDTFAPHSGQARGRCSMGR